MIEAHLHPPEQRINPPPTPEMHQVRNEERLLPSALIIKSIIVAIIVLDVRLRSRTTAPLGHTNSLEDFILSPDLSLRAGAG